MTERPQAEVTCGGHPSWSRPPFAGWAPPTGVASIDDTPFAEAAPAVNQIPHAGGLRAVVNHKLAENRALAASETWESPGWERQRWSPTSISAPMGAGRRRARRARRRWFDRGLVWSYAFHHEEAIRCFGRAVEQGPNAAAGWAPPGEA